MRKQLAKISSAKLCMEPVFTFSISVKYEDSGLCQGVGGFVLDEWSETLNRRVGSVYGCDLIIQILAELQVDDFSEMKGKHIWVWGEGESFAFSAMGIESLDTNNKNHKPVIFKEVYDFWNLAVTTTTTIGDESE